MGHPLPILLLLASLTEFPVGHCINNYPTTPKGVQLREDEPTTPITLLEYAGAQCLDPLSRGQFGRYCPAKRFCIPSIFLCDGVKNCPDGNDEWECVSSSTLPPTFPPAAVRKPVAVRKDCLTPNGQVGFRCFLGHVCRPIEQFCNANQDCPLGEDEEEDCNHFQLVQPEMPIATSTRNPLSIGPLNSLELGLFLDSDVERPCQYAGSFWCTYQYNEGQTGRCVPKEWRCDGDSRCYGGTDELNCPTRGTLPTLNAGLQRCLRMDQSVGFACSLGGWCNRNSSLCNGLNDCLHGNDELNCPAMVRSPLAVTLAGMVSCVQRNGAPGVKCEAEASGCAPYDYLCDGEQDCSSGKDEFHCPAGTPKKGVTPCVRTDGTAGYQCLNKYAEYCFPARWKCDGDNDCEDGKDEADCPNGVSRTGAAHSGTILNPVTYPLCRRVNGEMGFACSRGGLCHSLSAFCDGQPHCFNGFDERNCPADGGRTQPVTVSPNDPAGLLRCLRPNGRGIGFRCEASLLEPCYDNSNACDGRRNCANGRDELNCRIYVLSDLKPGFQACRRFDGTDGILCAVTGLCMPHAWLCDGDRDCFDGSDEMHCRSSSRSILDADDDEEANDLDSCGEGEFQCSSGRCVPNRYRCDGSADCQDQSDELNCSSRG
ncbi:putative Sortilin-related receptor [Hypsibius exemplaris]|uniref:Sortilin-related receptor n=1 Tax=Hypsibius exemplaris TaxID=2072580 RepID=A0A1W0X9P2_HYPEX|nr:putative Sortilin-related receptor [Hypsibius exemplaris]